jgi:hypothetical protein
MSQRTPQQRPPAARDAAPAQRATAGPADTSLKTLSSALNAAPTAQRLATMAPNRTGLPDTLKAGVEAMSGMSLDHVRVHRNSAKPAQLNAHAYAQGSDIHLAPGQERHLPHEAWHVVQQAQGRVKPTMQMKGDVPVNDEEHLEHEADVMGAKALAGAAQRAAVEDEEVHQAAGLTLQRVVSSRAVVQRAGVKAELSEASNNFAVFIEETKLINGTRDEVATAIYNTYKPPTGQPRDRFDRKVQHQGTNPNFNNDIALGKAQRLNHWTQNSINAASRIYEELLKATEYNDNKGIGLHEITVGQDTKTEPDVYTNDTTAFEVKRIDSASQGSVDSHITKCSEQLDSRNRNEIANVDITKWVAQITIANAENPWPYTPVALSKALKSKKLDPEGVGLDRITKYENSTKRITYLIHSANPYIGQFQVKA